MLKDMISLPSLLKRYLRQAKEMVAQGLIKDLEFSGGTYQVLVIDPEGNKDKEENKEENKEEWAFLQFDHQGRLKDSFCSCSYSETHRACVHQAAAFVYIHGSHSLPLHVRFERSLWNHLCRQFADQYLGVIPSDPKKDSTGGYSFRQGKKILFSIKGHTPEVENQLKALLIDRKKQTEENSLKFSNLSEEEMLLWQKGRPPEKLAYELSLWSDLAKMLMAFQEEGIKYKLSFKYNSKKLPNHLIVDFDSVTVEWDLNEEILKAIIPSLSTVDSPLAVHWAYRKGIEQITYDKVKHCFVIKAKKVTSKSQEQSSQGISLGQWSFVPGDGFYSYESRFPLDEEELKDVDKVLNDHTETIKSLIKGSVVRESPIHVSYHIAFDDQWNLHIEPYLFHPGDMAAPGSHLFNSWIYLNDNGFYRVDDRYFEQIKTVISASEIGDFVSQHRTWLNTQAGFGTHMTPIEADLTYQLTDSSLSFSRSLGIKGDIAESKDFGRWVYLPGQGFFSKLSMQTSLPLHAGTAIPASQIPVFIRRNHEELKLVQGFFNPRCPVVKAKLDIRLLESQDISIDPQYELAHDYKNKKVQFFDDVVYVEGEGFHELPPGMRLPEKYNHHVTVDAGHMTSFIGHDLQGLLPFANYVDPKLKRTSSRRLFADEISYADEENKLEYALKLSYRTDLGTISVASLWQALKEGKQYVFSDAGLIDLTDRQLGWLRKIEKNRVNTRQNKLLMSSLELLRLNAFEEIQIVPGKDQIHQHSLQLFNELMEFKIPVEPDLTGLTSQLRPYQFMGVKWLWFLYHHGLSGLLCDDMGLGKTHQAMGLLMACANYWKQQKAGVKRHFLVVCPTSVIYHWQEKLAKYLPGLRVWTFYGANRSLERFYEDSDILLTSYGIWRNESAALSKMGFEIAIFDELQIAKNQNSRIYNALLKANARMRLGMTGTPIENHLRELKSLFDLVLPTYMPSENDYRSFFVRPIEREGDQTRKQLLSRLIKPFVLRRKKEDVLLDLPEKTEEIAHCDLMPQQHQLYTEVLSASRDRIIDELKDDANPVPYMHIFALLSHLKQICNHPAAYLKKPEEYRHFASGKWDLFLELLNEARESGQKVVVFSQYLAMLDIIEMYMKEHHIGYATIRGSTANRGEQLKQFNENPKCEVFIGSLQAAGLGVDLTAGSVVIHYDRWWNAARENQATDRVHRIGQTRGVQVFKLMTKGTLEEHIDFMIARKGQLLEDVVSVDDHKMIKKFDRQEMISLLQTLGS